MVSVDVKHHKRKIKIGTLLSYLVRIGLPFSIRCSDPFKTVSPKGSLNVLLNVLPGRGHEKVVYHRSQRHLLSVSVADCCTEVEGRAPQEQVDCPTDTQDGKPLAHALVRPSVRFPSEAEPVYHQCRG